MTDIKLPHRELASNSNLTQVSPADADTTLLLFERIAAKQNQIFKLNEHIAFFRDLVRRIGGTISLFAGMKDEKYRENQFYNVLNCYICGDLSGAYIYQAKAMCKPEGLWQRIRYGYRVNKARKQLRSLLSFIDRSRCRQKFLDYKDNEDYCMCMKLILNVRQPDKKAHDFLQRRVSHERRYLDNLKLIAEKSEANISEKEDKKIKKVIEWISKEQAVNKSTSRIQADRLLLKDRLH